MLFKKISSIIYIINTLLMDNQKNNEDVVIISKETLSYNNISSQFAIIGLLTLINSILTLVNISLYFPAGINFTKVIIMEFFLKSSNLQVIYALINLILAILYLYLSGKIKSTKTKHLKRAVLAGTLIYVIDILFTIYYALKFPMLISGFIDFIFHIIILYSILKSIQYIFRKVRLTFK